MKKILFISMLLASGGVLAGQQSLEKSSNPGPANIRPNSTTISQFSVRLSDLPRDSLGKPMKINEIEWRTTHYPAPSITERVEICYQPRGAGVNRPELCEEISPDASGNVERFRSQPFAFESRIIIRHKFSGPRTTVQPAGLDHVTIHFSY